jgi:putative inorganic carbon (HCO3(-)) transporter
VLAGALAAIYKRSPLAAGSAIAAASLCGFATFLTLSRAGLLALGVTLLAGLFVASRRRGWVALVALIVSVSSVVYFGVLAGPSARERVTTLGSGTGRLDIWTVGGRMFSAHPLRGVGAGNFQISSVHYLLKPGTLERSDLIVDEPKEAHNIYLSVLAEEGLIGLVPFLLIFLFALACSLRASRAFQRAKDADMQTLSRALFVAEIGVLAAAFFASIQFNNQLWLLLALGPALLAISRTAEPDETA